MDDERTTKRIARTDRARLIERARIGLWIIVVSNLLFAITDLRLSADQLISVWGLKAGQLLVVAGAFVVLRTSLSRRVLISTLLFVFAAVNVLVAISGAVSGGVATTMILCLAMTWGAAVLLPWGPLPQAAAATLAGGAMATNVYLIQGDLTASIVYPGLAVVIALGVSVYLSHELQRQRRALGREIRERERLQSQQRKVLEEQVRERTLALQAANEQLRASAGAVLEATKRFQVVSELTSDYAYAFRIDPDGRAVPEWVTERSFTRITGYSADELERLGGGIYIVHPDDMESAWERVQVLIAGQTDTREFRIITKSGDVRWIRETARPEWGDQESRVVRVYGAAQDVTPRVEADQARSRAEISLRRQALQRQAVVELGQRALSTATVPELIDEAVCVVSETTECADCTFLEPSEDEASLFVTARLGLVARAQSFPALSGSPEAEALLAREARIVEDLGDEPVLSIPPAVNERYRSAMVALVPGKSRPRGLLAVYSPQPGAFGIDDLYLVQTVANLLSQAINRRDSEDRLRQAERRYEDLYENAPDMFVSVEIETGSIIQVNQTLERATGYARSELLGRPVDVLCNDAEKRGPTILEELVENGEVRDLELRVQCKYDAYIDIVMNASAVRDAHGRVVQGRLVLRDITQQKLLAEQLQQAQKMEAVGRLAGGVAHDFNNQLFVIKGYAELLAKRVQDSDPTLAGPIDEIHSAAQRSADLTRQLLAFSRKQMLQPKVIDLNAEVLGIQKMLRRLIGEDIELEIATDENAGYVKVDPTQLQQVIMNLAVNARDAMPDGGELILETRLVGREVMLVVRDTGEGMDEETQTRIFEPFFTTKELGKGTGLGLATVHGVVAQSGGRIEVSSTVGEGSEFRIYLPSVADPPEREERVGPGTSPGGKETILLAEDESNLRSFLGGVLREHGYEVIEAANGVEALEAVGGGTESVKLLITDMIMPRMGGIELVKKLRPLCPRAKVLYMTGYSETPPETEEPVIMKPCPVESFMRQVREILDRGGGRRDPVVRAPGPH